MNGTRPGERLQAALRMVAEDDATLSTSLGVEPKLLAEARAIARTRRTRQWIVQSASVAALAAIVAVPVWHAARSRSLPIDRGAVAGASAAQEVTTDFFPLAYSTVPAPGGYVVRMQVPRTALTSFGVAGFGAPEDRSPTVLADVVVGGDGLARAVRFVHLIGTSAPQQEQQ